MPARSTIITALLLVLALSVACEVPGPALSPTSEAVPTSSGVSATVQPTATPVPPAVTPTQTGASQTGVETVTFTTEDGVKLSGKLLGAGGDIAVVLAHQGYSNQYSWYSFATTIAKEGFTALTFDFRGIGQSEGYFRASQSVKDVRAAIKFLRDRGYQRIVCMGASFGGTACLKAASETDLDGLVILASRMSEGDPTTVTARDLAVLEMPKLFICAQDDHNGQLVGVTTRMYELSPDPKELKIFPGTAHGTSLFSTTSGAELRDLLVDFLKKLG